MKKIEIVIPAYNEESVIIKSLERLLAIVNTPKFQDFDILISVGDNASTDSTFGLVTQFIKKYYAEKDFVKDKNNVAIDEKHITHSSKPKAHSAAVRVIQVPEKGRGRVLQSIWSNSEADILVYMDADLSTDLVHLYDLIQSISDGSADITYGTRYVKDSQIERNIKRMIIGKVHAFLGDIILGVKFTDTYCGFKACRRSLFNKISYKINPAKWENGGNAWFWDVELLYWGYKSGAKLKEIPVKWIDQPDSKVNLLKDVKEDLLGLLRLRGDKL